VKQTTLDTRHRKLQRQATLDTRHRKSRDTYNIRYKTQKVQKHRQHWIQDTESPRDTDNSRYKRPKAPETHTTLDTRHRTGINETHNKIQYRKVKRLFTTPIILQKRIFLFLF
jgi:hypothetical protein